MSFEYKAADNVDAIAILAIAIVAGERLNPTSIIDAVNVLHQSGRNTSDICDQLQAIGSKLQDSKRDKSIPF